MNTHSLSNKPIEPVPPDDMERLSKIAQPDIEEAAFVHELRAARDADLHAVLFGPQFIGSAKQGGNARVHKHRGLFRGLGGIDG